MGFGINLMDKKELKIPLKQCDLLGYNIKRIVPNYASQNFNSNLHITIYIYFKL
jgi:hypothetical protein